jgi:amidase
MARDIEGLIVGMTMLEPGFALAADGAGLIGRVQIPGLTIDPLIDAAVDRALARAELDVIEITIPDWGTAHSAAETILCWEALQVNHELIEDPRLREKLGPLALSRLDQASSLTRSQMTQAESFGVQWSERLSRLFAMVEVLALPTVAFFPPPLDRAQDHAYSLFTKPVNMAKLPALSLPVPSGHLLPTSLQLIGPPDSEAMLLRTGLSFQRSSC